MPSRRIATARTDGTCPTDFAHDRRIRPGQRIITTTYFESDEHVRDFGVAPLSRSRSCVECTAQQLRASARSGTLHTIAGLSTADLLAAGIITTEDVEAVAGDWRTVMADLV